MSIFFLLHFEYFLLSIILFVKLQPISLMSICIDFNKTSVFLLKLIWRKTIESSTIHGSLKKREKKKY